MHSTPLCPRCLSDERVVPIAYGLPGDELNREADRGDVVLGGCSIYPHSPQWFCKGCEESFGRFETQVEYAR